jgi:hypothetical protein
VTHIRETQGVFLPESERTPEGIARHIAEISDDSGARTLDGAYDQIEKIIAVATRTPDAALAGEGR